MLRAALIYILFLSLINTLTAQIRATTENGKSVLLFKNGTWQYDEMNESNPTLVTETIIATSVHVDSTRDITTDSEEILYLPSTKLVRYFGENGGKIRCKLSSSNNLGKITIQFSWEFPVVDSHRYFGYFNEGTSVIFTTLDGSKINVMMGGKSDIKRLEGRNYSVITNSTYPLTADQLTTLSRQPIRKIEVGWKKKSEEYLLENSHILMEQLIQVF